MWIDEDEKIVHKGQRHNQKGRNKRFNPYQNVVSLMVSLVQVIRILVSNL